MEKYQEAKENAIRYMRVADHVLTMTYPIVQDPKLLKLVFKNLFMSMQNLVLALLHYETKHFKIPEFIGDFPSALEAVKPVMKKHKINIEYYNFLDDLNQFMETQNESDVEFVRKDRFVFASEDYRLNIISKEKLKEYIIKGKLLMKEMQKVIK
ncbi:TPA: hypothetical protein HA239_03070 [Candidatus Woesearchaeota archaeon]|nr:hypothetical protein QT06_C0001G0688 [archaeon GW2011_AR15]MBS3103525.1 hypothetical protein [Candidatus Woesearchaeota archaeon]HIH41371.1 hypothetical protein [Candidatus Woesearchaeota archaeon]